MKYKTFRALVGSTLLLGAFGLGFALRGSGKQGPVQPLLDERPVPTPAVPSPLAPPPVAATTSSGPEYERYLARTLGQPATGDKIKDALGGRSAVKVNVYAEKGRWGRAKVDLNRNERWDEKWWLDGDRIVREVAPADDESYGPAQELVDGSWKSR